MRDEHGPRSRRTRGRRPPPAGPPRDLRAARDPTRPGDRAGRPVAVPEAQASPARPAAPLSPLRRWLFAHQVQPVGPEAAEGHARRRRGGR